MKTMYLVNPSSDVPTYFGAEVYAGRGFRPATLMADLAIPTLAAMAPAEFPIALCDENLEPVDFDVGADFVGITGKITQRNRMITIATEFRARGATIVIGGPYATLSPEVMRPYCDVLVRGEAEDVSAALFADLAAGTWRDEYVGGKADLADTPVPRWSLYPHERAAMGTVQTSRGCPFECEFCDVIQYLGRRQRHKPVAAVLAELDVLYREGYRKVFIADDNFTAYRSRAKELLVALGDWNWRSAGGRMSFVTQVSIDAARDDELLRLCAEAGLTHVFVGIETPNEESLREAHKRQNLRVDLAHEVQRFLDHGIAVTAGMIVGFDSDHVDIFQRQYEFAMSMPIPIFSLGALVAPAATPLYARMATEGRLVADGSEVAAMPWNTNIDPRNMSRADLLRGIRWLCNKLYEPAAFGDRVHKLIDRLGERRDPRARERGWRRGEARSIDADSIKLLKGLIALGPAEAEMCAGIGKRLVEKPAAADYVLPALVQYLQVRYVYEQGSLWNPRLAATPTPCL